MTREQHCLRERSEAYAWECFHILLIAYYRLYQHYRGKDAPCIARQIYLAQSTNCIIVVCDEATNQILMLAYILNYILYTSFKASLYCSSLKLTVTCQSRGEIHITRLGKMRARLFRARAGASPGSTRCFFPARQHLHTLLINYSSVDTTRLTLMSFLFPLLHVWNNNTTRTQI